MKKIVLCLYTLLLGGIINANAQCSVTINADKTKICSNDKVTLSALSSDIQTLPDFSESNKVFDVKDLNLDVSIISLIQSGAMNNVAYAFPQSSDFFTLSLNGYQLKNTVIASGSIDVIIETDLKQDLKVVFELPYFKINGKSIKDSIYVDGKSAGTSGFKSFTKSFDLKGAVIDFSAGDPTKYNLVKYIVKPSIKITTTNFTGVETGTLKLNFHNVKFIENSTYDWYKDGALLTDKKTHIIEVNQTGKYLVKTTSTCGESKDSINIQVVEMPSNKVTINGNLTFCEGDSIQLIADGNGTYKWSNNGITKESYISKTGSYTVTITNDICSITSDLIKIKVNQNPIVKLNHKDTTIIVGNEITLIATGAKTYEWSNKSKIDSISVSKEGTYSVIGTNEFGCTSGASVKVDVREKGAGLATLNGLAVKVSPNPTSDVLHITVNEFKNRAITLADLNGKVVYTQSLTTENTTIAVDSFSKGVYMLNIIDGTNTSLKSQRIVIE
jgi:hypothetical protein